MTNCTHGIELSLNGLQILTSLVKSVEVPITCKIRILPTIEETVAFAKLAESTGIAALAVHGRYVKELGWRIHLHRARSTLGKLVTEPCSLNGQRLLKCFLCLACPALYDRLISEKPREPAHYDHIAAIACALSIPVIAKYVQLASFLLGSEYWPPIVINILRM